jgi:hypothetical protein
MTAAFATQNLTVKRHEQSLVSRLNEIGHRAVAAL